jgi:hypothetical protein
MRTRYVTLAVFAAAVLLSPIRYVEACGPFFEDDVFVNSTHPDDLASFSTGRLGILQAGFDSNEYAVAYRYLNGGQLSAAERRAYVSPAGVLTVQDSGSITPEQMAAAQAAEPQVQENAQPPVSWPFARAEYPPFTPPETRLVPTNSTADVILDEDYLNCPVGAFATAALTLNKRAETWGKQSKWLIDWIHGQDAVFANCDNKTVAMPTPATADSPALLKADRAYQIAAANLYTGKFDEAARQFAAIAADGGSPWSQWGTYLAARATVRKAFAMGKATDPYSGSIASYDDATMRRAQQMLEPLLAQPNPTPSRAIIQSELNFIRIRTEPEKRAAEISAALAGPASDPNFSQDLQDLSWILSKQIKVQNPAPLMAWIAAWRGSGTAASAFAIWQQDHALPWLIMALVKAGPSDPFAPALLDAAAKIAPGTPAFDTVFYNRVRLLTALNRSDEARALLDAALPALRSQKPSSKLNALLGERMAVARDFNEFLAYAPRFTLSTGSQGADDLQSLCNDRANAGKLITDYKPAPCPEAKILPRFDEDAAEILNQQIPLAMLIQAASTASLPQDLRQDIAVVAWTRAVLLQDAQSAAALQALLPKAIRDAAGSSIGFPADLAILNNPGIRPYLEAGVSRVASYSYFDSFRNNWWCKPWNDQPDSYTPNPKQHSAPSFLTPDQLAQATAQYQPLQQLPDGASVIGQGVVDYANAHPGDPQVPQALALTVRATHYACQTYAPNAPPRPPGDTTTEYTPVSKAAFELLHKRYPKSPWTAKTPYYY